jgi:biotin-(acetyl-CoA carboxylase) ligase
MLIEENVFSISNGSSLIINKYTEKLFGIGQQVTFLLDNKLIEGRFLGVNQKGAIQIDAGYGVKSYVNGEIRLVNTLP